jgi:hypothetical protein
MVTQKWLAIYDYPCLSYYGRKPTICVSNALSKGSLTIKSLVL